MTLINAFIHRFGTIDGRTGADLVGGTDADLLSLLQLAGDERATGWDQMYAEVIVTDTRIRVAVEQARLRNVRPFERRDPRCAEGCEVKL